ncbi:DUF3298 and DUF4163 domain-containing protein [Aneurinibacillus sp. Ricciae_BoGa-3]|uniref:DUF3298 and DUF4163 domain-containing protein n=1 Tax=Aneurinibacillus sp. Ricciae_BoGa-3 TaxID=3022697 RepID=UPI00233FD44C|nr:DUF3298 and DUF4163 domain-containing protein [Aneurinibacillus sp. Ricciae_BoGa-3]WCK54478.1 DUF3298 and DUF4163 domain-containing protein [Aneurinibacillus sp. Ricciae_BoGa-3]
MKRLLSAVLLSAAAAGTCIGAAPIVYGAPAAVTSSQVKIISQSMPINLEHVTGKITYPKFEGIKNSKVQNTLNTLFLAHAQTVKASAVKLNQEAQGSYSPEAKLSVETQYAVKRNKNGIVSAVFTDYSYTGGAHGMYDKVAYTVDANSGRIYQLKDLFKKGTNYTAVINAEIRAQLKTQKEYFWQTPFKGIPANQRYYLTNQGIVIYFGLYEYTPYVNGMPEFFIPYSKISKYLMAAVR